MIILNHQQELTCNTGNAGIVFTDDCEAQGNWTGNFGTSNGTWQVNDGGTASGGTGPDGAHSGVNYFIMNQVHGVAVDQAYLILQLLLPLQLIYPICMMMLNLHFGCMQEVVQWEV